MKLYPIILITLMGFSFIGFPVSTLYAQSLEKIKNEKENWRKEEFYKQMIQFEGKDSVDIFGFPLEELPDAFYDNTQIRYLRIDCIEPNRMVRLSPQIAKLTKLETLILAKTALKSIPHEIGQLKKLRELRVLGGGELNELPDEIGELKNLKILDLWRNNLRVLPQSIYKLKKLNLLFVGENRFSHKQIQEIKSKFPNTTVKIYR